MNDATSGFDFFARCASLIDDVTAIQQSFVDDVARMLSPDEERPKGIVDTLASCNRNLFEGVAANPAKIANEALSFWQGQVQLAHNSLLRLIGEKVEPVTRPRVEDRRFIDPEWDESVFFDYLKQSYLLTATHLVQTVEGLEGVPAAQRKRLTYYARQLTNALAPTNFPLTNPEVLRRTLATNGENLLRGVHMLAEDKRRSAEILNICTSSPEGFELGVNIACTPGKVVRQNRLMQLLQYEPATTQVERTPILFVPSWVNKYYVVDLSPANSMVRWLVEQGYTVFAISWVNPDASFRDVSFADYMREGPLAAASWIEQLTGEPQVSAIGYCLGGILLSCTLAWCAARGEDRFATATYLAASLDFTSPGDMGIFVDKPLVQDVERQLDRTGYFDGRLLAAGFSLLKENDLYWNYYVINYLKGERPAAFDLMHWNSDNTHVPAATHKFVIRSLHLDNGLMRPGAIELAGEPIDLARIEVPTYALAAQKDHIARWESCFPAAQLQSGAVRFVLSGSGHIAGVINPPAAKKYCYYLNSAPAPAAAQWLDGAFKVEGSWWPDWHQWQQRHGSGQVGARVIDAAHVIEAAPGSYARRRIAAAETWVEAA